MIAAAHRAARSCGWRVRFHSRAGSTEDQLPGDSTDLPPSPPREAVVGNDYRTEVEGDFVDWESVGLQTRRVAKATCFVAVGGLLYKKHCTPADVLRICRNGLNLAGATVRYPLMHSVGAWDPSVLDGMDARTAEYYTLTSGPDKWPEDVRVVPELILFRRALHRIGWPAMIPNVPHPLGVICYGGQVVDTQANKLAGSLVGIELTTATARLLVRRLLRSSDWALLARLYPSGNKALAVREKLDVVDAWKVACRVLAVEDLALCLYAAAGLGGQTLCRILLWVVAHEDAKRVLRWLVECGCFTGDIKTSEANLKKWHTLWRSADCTVVPQLRRVPVDICLYVHLLIGRIAVPGEVAMSTLSQRWERRLPSHKGVIDSFADEWLGALLSQVSVDMRGLPRDERALIMAMASELTSGASSAKMPPELSDAGLIGWTKARAYVLGRINEYAQYLAQQTCLGTAILKYESGARCRPLLPSRDDDWVRWTVLLMWIEGKLWRRLSASPMAWDDAQWLQYGLAMRTLTASGAVLGASDFDDYNQLHTNKLMGQIARRIGRYLSQVATNDMYSRIGDAIASGIDGNRLRVGRESHHTNYGLWSGWRSTSFINTILNPVYNHFEEQDSDRSRGFVFLGDDSVDVFDSIMGACKHLAHLDEQGFEAQHTKQLVSTRRAEFLRIMWRDGLPGCGSLIRALSNGVSSDLQGGQIKESLSMQWLESWLSNLVRRGAHISARSMRLLRGVVRAKIAYVHRNDSADAANTARITAAAWRASASRKNIAGALVSETMQAYGCYEAAAIKREYIRAAFASAPIEYTAYNKPRDVPVIAEEVVLGRKYVTEWDDEQLRLVSELVSKLLGVVACSVSARTWMLSHFSKLDLIEMGHMNAHASRVCGDMSPDSFRAAFMSLRAGEGRRLVSYQG